LVEQPDLNYSKTLNFFFNHNLNTKNLINRKS
jgi:hypothetical protein